jgi:hypothetical protein
VRITVDLSIFLEEIVLVLQFVSDLTNQELSPSMHDVESSGLVVAILFGLHVGELVGQLKHLLVGVHVAVLLVLDTLLGENTGH